MSNQPTETMRERVGENRYKLWILMRMDRMVLAGAIASMVFGALLAISFVGPAPMHRVVETADGLWWVFSALITAVITVVALVVTFNQLVLSQELGALGDQRKRMQDAEAFREDVEQWLDVEVSPPEPASFMSAILASIHHHADTIQPADEIGEELLSYRNEVCEDARTVGDSLENAQFGTFDLVFAALNFNYSWKIYEAKRLMAEREAHLSEKSMTALEDLVTILGFFGPAREHIKTLYFQWELVNLSRAMLYSSLPALVVATGMLLYVDTAGVSATTLGVDNLVWLVTVGITVALLPFFILVSFVLRIATVAKRTLAIGPFVLRDVQ